MSENCGITDPARSMTGERQGTGIVATGGMLLGKASKKRAGGFNFMWKVRLKEHKERKLSQQMVKKME